MSRYAIGIAAAVMVAVVAAQHLTTVQRIEQAEAALTPMPSDLTTDGQATYQQVIQGLTTLKGQIVTPPPPPAGSISTIVFVLTDDLNEAAFADVLPLLPNLQAMAAAGVTFSQAFVATPLCCPTRSTLLTGLYASQHGVVDNSWPLGGAAKLVDTNTLPVWLRAAGWRTAWVGKYLNEFDNTGNFPTWPYIPPGWDEFRVQVEPVGYNDYTMHVNGTPVFYGSGEANRSTPVIFSHAAEVIQQTPSGQPLFVVVAPNAPHSPWATTSDDLATVSGIAAHRPPSFNEVDVSDKPNFIQNTDPLSASDIGKIDANRQKYMATMLGVDRGMGALRDALIASGRMSDALIVFTSDNGFLHGEHRLFNGKKCAYEECIGVPMIVQGPQTAGTVDDRLVSSLDWSATIADLAGVTPPYALPGMSLAPVLAGQSVPWRDAVIVEWLGQEAARPKFTLVREPSWVYVEYQNGAASRELYHLPTDPYQLHNLVNDPAYAAEVTRLQARLAIH